MTGIAIIVYGILLLLTAYACLQLQLVLKSKHFQKKTAPKIAGKLPFITVQVPLYNEPACAERIIQHCAAFDYPKDLFEIQVLDDSNDNTVEICRELCRSLAIKGIQIQHIRRETREGYKAGALNYGLTEAKGNWVAVFDADFMPKPSFLKEIIPYTESNPAFIQARWGHKNEHLNFLTRIQGILLDYHFSIEHIGRSEQNCFINFNGTAGIWNKEAIQSSGGWNHTTITEDLELSYRVQLNGWKGIYLPNITVPAELPEDQISYRQQQFRWTKGGAETFLMLKQKLFQTKLPLRTKVHAFTHLFSSSLIPFGTLLFLSVLLGTIECVFFNTNSILIALSFSLIPSIILFGCIYTSVKRNGKSLTYFFKHLPYLFFVQNGLLFNNSKGIVQAYCNIKTPFLRTPKGKQAHSNSSFRIHTAEFLIGLVCVFCSFLSIYKWLYPNAVYILISGLGILYFSIKRRHLAS